MCTLGEDAEGDTVAQNIYGTLYGLVILLYLLITIAHTHDGHNLEPC